MANGHGGTREGAGRPQGSTRRARYLGSVLAAEKALFSVLPDAIDCLKAACQRGDTHAAGLVLKYALVPAEKREGEAKDLERLRMADDGDDDAQEAEDDGDEGDGDDE